MPQIMGILNCTPDSFFDGGKYVTTDALVNRGLTMMEEGADWIDIGGESTRPGAEPVSENEELKRVIPVIEGLAQAGVKNLSIDTTKALVAREALRNGVAMINDVSALRADPQMVDVIRTSCGVKVVLMHSRGDPQTMQSLAHYEDVVTDVIGELRRSVERALTAGIERTQIMIDPGFGFAKDFRQNVCLLKNVGRFKEMGFPVMVGISRKSFLGQMVNRSAPADRLYASLGGAFYAAEQGVDMLRVHDVKETREMLEVLKGLRG